MSTPRIEGAQVVLPCPRPMAATLDFFTDLGFRVRTIMPADEPAMAVLEGHGLTLRLDVRAHEEPGRLLLHVAGEPPLRATAPNGTIVEFVDANPAADLPSLRESFVVTRLSGDGEFHLGRAGMMYRDLIPDRLGGRFIASHILIPRGGPVDDYVHYHHVRFQMIYCSRGWVEVAYEDQGDPIVLSEGDCVLQPATIRHRVLEASDRMQVIEVSCPAEHETWSDPAMELPTGRLLPDRGYGADGHRFVHHVAKGAAWEPWRLPGFVRRDVGIGAATDGLAGVRVVRPAGFAPSVTVRHHGEFSLLFVLDGGISLQREDDAPLRLTEGDCVVMPSGTAHTLSDASLDLQLLDVTLPDAMAVSVE